MINKETLKEIFNYVLGDEAIWKEAIEETLNIKLSYADIEFKDLYQYLDNLADKSEIDLKIRVSFELHD